ncbi:MAG: hypothetical protein U9Q35_11915 [Pseudomonadota bacterium]|nr:hypothetical protein [Pseudomonadota bacterium]
MHAEPDPMLSVRELFGIDSDLEVPAFSERDDYVPEIDPAYRFNPDVTLAILAGFTRNRRVMVQGLHGTGKSTHIEQVAARLNWPCLRVNLDGMALRLLHSDAALHRRLCPEDAIERLVFELLEQLRVETRVPGDMPGMVANLDQRFTNWSRHFYRSGLTEGTIGLLLYSVAQICWSRLQARPVLEETEDTIEGTRASLVGVLGTALAGIRRYRHDQAAFADHALAIARATAEQGINLPRLARRLARPENRRILIVISDGCPSDGATNLANDPYYLDNHLKEVVARRTREGQVEVLGLGVGLDLSPFYRRCLATDLAQGLDTALFDEIVALIGGRHRR